LPQPPQENGHILLPLEPSRSTARAHEGSPWDPLFTSYVLNAPRQLLDGAPHHLKARFDGLTLDHIQSRWIFLDRHLSHEASAFLAAPCEETAVLTLDGRGERASTSYGVYRDGRYTRLKQVELPHSLGLLYEDVTRYLGFLHSSDEYKVMALASFGQPEYLSQMREIVRLDDEGGYRIEPTRLRERFGPPRQRGAPFDTHHKNLASSLQYVLEETTLHMARWLHGQTGARHLAMAGGVALNCVMNARLSRDGPFEHVWVQPAAGDSGTSLGAALYVDHQRRGGPRRWTMEHAYLGPAYDDDEIERF